MGASLYETDFAAWVAAQIACLKSGDVAALDREHVARARDKAPPPCA